MTSPSSVTSTFTSSFERPGSSARTVSLVLSSTFTLVIAHLLRNPARPLLRAPALHGRSDNRHPGFPSLERSGRQLWAHAAGREPGARRRRGRDRGTTSAPLG